MPKKMEHASLSPLMEEATQAIKLFSLTQVPLHSVLQTPKHTIQSFKLVAILFLTNNPDKLVRVSWGTFQTP